VCGRYNKEKKRREVEADGKCTAIARYRLKLLVLEEWRPLGCYAVWLL
jgi:hypothetical protein